MTWSTSHTIHWVRVQHLQTIVRQSALKLETRLSTNVTPKLFGFGQSSFRRRLRKTFLDLFLSWENGNWPSSSESVTMKTSSSSSWLGSYKKHFLNFRVSFLVGKRKTYRYLLPEARPVVGSTREDPRGGPRYLAVAPPSRPCPSRTGTPILPPPPSPYGKASLWFSTTFRGAFCLWRGERKFRSMICLCGMSVSDQESIASKLKKYPISEKV